MQYIDLYTWLRGDILVKADRISMAHSLEVRVPFLDREVFDVASRIPVELKLPPRSDATKWAMRQALAGRRTAGDRQPQEAGLPDADPRLAGQRDVRVGPRIIGNSGAGELIDLNYALRLLDEHKKGEVDHSRKVWTVLVFCIWHAIFVARTLDPGITRNQSALLTKPVVGSMVA